jgi:hypothetical protein
MEWLFGCVYGTGTGCSGVFMAQELVAQVCLWHMNWLLRCVYGTGTGCSGVFMAQELVAQVCYGTAEGYAGVLWHGKGLFRCVTAEKQVT